MSLTVIALQEALLVALGMEDLLEPGVIAGHQGKGFSLEHRRAAGAGGNVVWISEPDWDSCRAMFFLSHHLFQVRVREL